MKCPYIPVAWGEVFDKLSILDIKRERLTDPRQLEHVQEEYDHLRPVCAPVDENNPVLRDMVNQLRDVNGKLWDIENGKRQCEKEQRFDAAFIQMARQVYLLNDARAAIKRCINLLLDSPLVEEKCHSC